ncbi:MAG TPA: TlyA family RNA methyltransferase [Halanaerobiales bacterium]|nr:TlyA family RNA methyltransferase [Halanaerobiales bacterium]
MTDKKRLDLLLVERSFFPSRSQAKRAIMAGKVYVDGRVADKAGMIFANNIDIFIKGPEFSFVSRGGLKLEKALKVFDVDPEGKEVIDIGASTGGFTDCLLQNGAAKVYAVDVGYGQLDWKLRQDKRVKVLERTNFRYLTQEKLPVSVPLIVSDVSFISLRLIIPAALRFLKEKGEMIALIKPQFEAGPERVGKKGLIKDRNVHIEVLEELSQFFDQKGLKLAGLDYSPVTGASSNNIEFLIYLVRTGEDNDLRTWDLIVEKVVDSAHQKHEGG